MCHGPGQNYHYGGTGQLLGRDLKSPDRSVAHRPNEDHEAGKLWELSILGAGRGCMAKPIEWKQRTETNKGLPEEGAENLPEETTRNWTKYPPTVHIHLFISAVVMHCYSNT